VGVVSRENRKLNMIETIQVLSKKSEHIQRKHPWIFSGAILKGQKLPTDGAPVRVTDEKGQFLCVGHYQDLGSISVRILSFRDEELSVDLFREKLSAAFNSRQQLINSQTTTCYRLIHGEGDGLPGLIVDRYGDALVIQCHSMGMFLIRHLIAEAFQDLFGGDINTIYCKSNDTLPGHHPNADEFLLGEKTHTTVLEESAQMDIHWVEGQKTGTFLDQRENRQLLKRYASGKTVLDLFCNNGGFGLHALLGNSEHVTFVDSSAKALARTLDNMNLNHISEDRFETVQMDCIPFLNQNDQQYDLVIVDPPAYAKSIQKRHNAIQGYKRLNTLALKKVKPGGLMFTFSCSQVVDEPLFYNTIVAACIESGRDVKVLHKMTQGPDHPVNIFHKEGAYLKGLVLQVNG